MRKNTDAHDTGHVKKGHMPLCDQRPSGMGDSSTAESLGRGPYMLHQDTWISL